MKRHGNLYEKIYDYANLELAFRKAARGRRYNSCVLKFAANLEESLVILQNELIWKTFRPAPYRSFQLYEGKQRTIYVAPFRERVLHHAIMNVVEPIWDKLFIYDSYACRKQKGAHRAADRTQAFLREATRIWPVVYCLKCDISKFFPSINHHALMKVIKRKIKCRDTLQLLDRIVFHAGDRQDPDSKNMPIGSLISQWAANLYLNELDTAVKYELRERFYLRYMDDFIILHGDKRHLHALKDVLAGFLWSHLRLQLNPKTDIFPASRGVDFVGYRIWTTHRLIRKSSIKRVRRRLRRFSRLWAAGRIRLDTIRASLASWLGHCRHADTYRLTRTVLEGFVLTKEGQSRPEP